MLLLASAVSHGSDKQQEQQLPLRTCTSLRRRGGDRAILKGSGIGNLDDTQLRTDESPRSQAKQSIVKFSRVSQLYMRKYLPTIDPHMYLGLPIHAMF